MVGKNHQSGKLLKIPRILMIMLMVLCLIFVIHKVIDWLKTRQIPKQITLKSLEIAQKKSNIFVIEKKKIFNNQNSMQLYSIVNF